MATGGTLRRLQYMCRQVSSSAANKPILSLTGTLFQVYPRHRWLGADCTVEQVALCEAVHGLASQTFARLLAGAGRPHRLSRPTPWPLGQSVLALSLSHYHSRSCKNVVIGKTRTSRIRPLMPMQRLVDKTEDWVQVAELVLIDALVRTSPKIFHATPARIRPLRLVHKTEDWVQVDGFDRGPREDLSKNFPRPNRWHGLIQKMPTLRFEPRLSRPQRDVLTTRRCRQMMKLYFIVSWGFRV